MLKILLLICMIVPVTLQAQVFKGAFALGMNLTQVDGDEVYGYKRLGIHAGPAVMLPMGHFATSMEIVFNQKGAYQKGAKGYTNPDTAEYKLRLNYVGVPLMIHYTDKDIVTIGTGVSWERLVFAEEWEHGRQTRTDATNNVYAKNDWNILVDLRFRIIKSLPNLYFNFRYAYSMSKIRSRTFNNGETRDQFNNVLTGRIIYIINSEQLIMNSRNTFNY